MAYNPGDLEGLADSIYARLGLACDEVRRPSSLARALYGAGSLHFIKHLRAQGYCGMLRGRPLIAVRAGMPRPRQEHTIGHELMHLALGTEHGESEELEWACDFGAAALQMPRRAYQRRINGVGANWSQLALDFGVTETSACLRAGEVEGRPIAVVARVVRARGAMQRHSEREIRSFVRRPADGIVSAKLRDERGRWVVEARWAEAG